MLPPALLRPSRVHAALHWLVPGCAVLAVALLVWGLYLALVASPPDYQQGETVRIMYVHVPMAWLAMGWYVALALASAGYLIWRTPISRMMAAACAPVGAVCAAATLATGALWGQPMWGTWWVWDARLTSMLILLMLYVGYLALQGMERQRARAGGGDMGGNGSAAAVLAVIGCVNLPIIKFSVDWWQTLHQPASVLRRGGAAIDPAMLTPLLVMAGAFTAWTGALVLLRLRTALLHQRAGRAALRAALRAEYTGTGLQPAALPFR